MKIELDVNPQDLTKSLAEILNTLTPEQKTSIAKETMEKWLREPYDAERLAKERDVVDAIKKDQEKRGYRNETEQEIRGGYDFRRQMEGFQSTKAIMVKEITQAVIGAYQSQVKQVVESDPKIQAMKDEVIEIIKETFPKTVHAAMVQWMASSMQTMFESTLGIRQFAEQSGNFQREVQNRIGQIEGRLSGRGI
jgi:YesN/AraC family two-component response regulator